MSAPLSWRFIDFAILRSAGFAAHRLIAVTRARAEEPDSKMAIELEALRSEAAKADFRDALWLASPDILERVAAREAAPGRSAERLDRKLYAYLQRFCAKNDTISAYGPISYLRIGTAGGRPRPLRLSRPRREAKLSHWACLRLARALAVNRAVALLAPLEPQPWLGATQLRSLTPLQREILAGIAERGPSLDEFAAEPGDGRARLAAALELVEGGYATPSLDPHPISFDGLESMAALLGAMRTAPDAARLRGEILHIKSGLDGLARSNALPRRIAAAQAIGRTLRRIAPQEDWRPPAGDPDRALFFEDAHAPARSAFLSPDDWERITSALDLPLRLMGARAEAKRRDWRDWCAALLKARGRSDVVTLEEMIEAVGEAGPGAPGARLERVEAFDHAMTGLLEGLAISASGIDLDPGAVETMLGGWPQPGMAFASPDLLFDAQPGPGTTIILGEVHGTATLWSFLLKFAPDEEREAIRATLAEWLSSRDSSPCELMIGRRRGRSFLLDLPALAIEAAHPAGPNATGRISFRDIRVDLSTFTVTDVRGRTLEILRSGWTGALADVLALEVEHFPLRLPAKDPRCRFTPRIRLGDLILQRARWEVEARLLQVPLATAPRGRRRRAAAGLRQRLGLPEAAYVVTAPGEKAVYLDFESELSLDWLTHAVRGTERMVFIEALPRPEDAWLETSRGRVCAEIRTTAFWGRTATEPAMSGTAIAADRAGSCRCDQRTPPTDKVGLIPSSGSLFSSPKADDFATPARAPAEPIPRQDNARDA